jgi:pilus assembly protein Flp/PilA
MNASIRNFLVEEDGVTALEYGILACIVAAALASAFLPKLETLYGTLMTDISNAVGSSTSSSSGSGSGSG